MNEYTKGPWKLFGAGVIQSECNGIVVCEIEEDKYGPKTDVERRANAHLIAATPDMYEILSRLMVNVGTNGHGTDSDIFYCEFCQESHEDYTLIPHTNTCAVTVAKQALAKAEGREQ